MQEDENTPNENHEEDTRSESSDRGIPILVLVVSALLLAAIGAGAWFGGQWVERREWEPKYTELRKTYDALDEDNEALKTRYASLELDKLLLDGSYTILEEDYADLQAENLALDAANTLLVEAADFYQEQYGQIADEINSKLGNSCEDKNSFITPADADVAARVMSIAGEYSSDVVEQWSDFYALFNWVASNIDYNHDTRSPWLPPTPGYALLAWQNDYWKTPSETLQDGTGDCEDMACLLASMLKNYTQGTITMWVIIWHSDNSGHAAVAFPVEGGYLTILDPAGNYQTGYPGYKYTSAAVDDWLGLWPSEPGIHIANIFSDTECVDFANTDEFIDWAAART